MNRIFDNSAIEDRIRGICEENLVSMEIFAACFYGPNVLCDECRKTEMNVLLVVEAYPKKISIFSKKSKGINLNILVIDKDLFESDVEQGRFGDLVSDIVSLPYAPWVNPNYFENIEVKVKRRFVLELIRNLILQYPELSDMLLIKPEYFMYETARRQVKLFPPLVLNLSDVFKSKMEKQNTAFIMKGYHKALKNLETENYITYSNGHVRIVKSFADETIRHRNRFSSVLTSIRKGLLPYIRSLSLRIRTGFWQNQILLNRRSKKQEKELRKELDETEKFLLMPSPLGLIPFSDKTTIQDFIQKTVPGGDMLDLEIEEMGGVLNSVFLLRIKKNHGTQKIVVKKYENWQGFKWFPLALWTLGTKSFAVLGKTRLEREYSNNRFLRDHGFVVPRILYVSVKERLIFEEYVDGEKLTEIIKRLIASPQENAVIAGEIVKTIGKEMARVHSLGVTLGDCKPENILVTENNDICFLDLEQSTRSGSKSWDIAEFLYYSGHYILPIHSDQAARIVATSLIEGYIQGKGKRGCVREAASAKYTKIFSVFTLPHIILIMANICKKLGKDETSK